MSANGPKNASEATNEAPLVASEESEEEGIGHFEEPKITSNPDEDEEDVEIRPKKNLGKDSAIPHEFNENVANWIRFFSQRDRERFQMFLDRGEPYREAVENILEENKVPADLYYLGLIESGFNFKASSRVKAVGVWQFMKPTGRMYGLGVDSYIDERRDPIRATEAAAKYLRDLYKEFRSWYLAMAAYNAGPGRIRSCIRKAGTDDFWELVEKKRLPRETMEYIPKYLAARYIGENPELFAFYVNEEKKYPNVELVKIPSPVKFESIEKQVGMPSGTLAFVNPHYLKNFSHPARKTDEIWVPEKYSAAVEKQFNSLEDFKIKVQPEKKAKVLAAHEKILVHIVKKGDTLKTIASNQGLSIAYLRRVNNLGKNAKVVPGQRLKLSASSYRQKKAHPRKTQRKKKK
jgi:membrane-bound lytic murein transglycosylase D